MDNINNSVTLLEHCITFPDYTNVLYTLKGTDTSGTEISYTATQNCVVMGYATGNAGNWTNCVIHINSVTVGYGGYVYPTGNTNYAAVPISYYLKSGDTILFRGYNALQCTVFGLR